MGENLNNKALHICAALLCFALLTLSPQMEEAKAETSLMLGMDASAPLTFGEELPAFRREPIPLEAIKHSLKDEGYHRVFLLGQKTNGTFLVEALTEFNRPVRLYLTPDTFETKVIVFLDVVTSNRGRPLPQHAVRRRLSHEGFSEIDFIETVQGLVTVRAQAREGHEVEVIVSAISGELMRITRLGPELF